MLMICKSAAIAIVIVRWPACILPDFAHPLDVHDAFHRLAVRRDGDQVISFSDGGTVASAAEGAAATSASSTAGATERADGTQRTFRRTEIDLTGNCATTQSAAPTTWTALTSRKGRVAGGGAE